MCPRASCLAKRHFQGTHHLLAQRHGAHEAGVEGVTAEQYQAGISAASIRHELLDLQRAVTDGLISRSAAQSRPDKPSREGVTGTAAD